MNLVLTTAAILGAVLAGAVSPGPSFILVSRIAILRSRRAGIAAALGMGVGGAIFGCLDLLGLATLLKEVPSLHIALKILGGTYLMYLAVRIWLGAKQPLAIQAADGDGRRSLSRDFALSLMTQLSNPKTAIVYASIFTAFLPAAPRPELLIGLVPGLFLVEFGWYAIVATLFSIPKPRQVYLAAKTRIDRAVAAVLGLLGARLAFEAVTD